MVDFCNYCWDTINENIDNKILFCVGCQQWYHGCCLNISYRTYNKIKNLNTWRCPQCKEIPDGNSNQRKGYGWYCLFTLFGLVFLTSRKYIFN